MKILTVSTLFPYENNPKHGIFVETRLKHLKLHFPDVEVKVIAPIPWFPFKHSSFGSYASYAKAPFYEKRSGFDVYHPRFIVVPKIGMRITPKTLEYAIYKQACQLIRQGYDFDLIDGHYFYPDGVAIANVAKKLGKPYTVTARGTDINLIPSFENPRKDIQSVLAQSSHNIAVCEALRQEMIVLGAKKEKVTTLRNGVDLNLFSFTNKQRQIKLRQAFNLPLDKSIVLSVGLLIERKGHHLVIEAIKKLPNSILLIAGSGEEEKRLNKLVQKENLQNQVKFLGDLTQVRLKDYYGIADILVLASSREGWANVLLESMACGTPVVATNIWGTPEVVQSPDAGILVNRSANEIASGINTLLCDLPERENTRKYAEQFNWYTTSKGQYEIFSSLISMNKEIKKLTKQVESI